MVAVEDITMKDVLTVMMIVIAVEEIDMILTLVAIIITEMTVTIAETVMTTEIATIDMITETAMITETVTIVTMIEEAVEEVILLNQDQEDPSIEEVNKKERQPQPSMLVTFPTISLNVMLQPCLNVMVA